MGLMVGGGISYILNLWWAVRQLVNVGWAPPTFYVIW